MHHPGSAARFWTLPAALRWLRGLTVALWTLPAVTACDSDTADPPPVWQAVAVELPGALFSAWSDGPDDVWLAGAGDPAKPADGPTVLRLDGKAWTRAAIAAPGVDLWWVSGLPKGDVWLAGTQGTIVRWSRSAGTYTVEKTPGTDHLFGILPVSPTEIWAVGGTPGCSAPVCGVVWRSDGSKWQIADVPSELLAKAKQWFKVVAHKGVVWIVGLDGQLLRYDGKTWSNPPSGSERTLLTAHCNSATCAAVGGANSGEIVELQASGAWKSVTPGKIAGLNGVHLTPDGGYAVGAAAAIVRRTSGGSWQVDTAAAAAMDKFEIYDDFHGVHVDSDGGVWAVGGQLLTIPPRSGMVVYLGRRSVPTYVP
jgi:hypothetical protein